MRVDSLLAFSFCAGPPNVLRGAPCVQGLEEVFLHQKYGVPRWSAMFLVQHISLEHKVSEAVLASFFTCKGGKFPGRL
jgi:hypothetical protein